jgi:hypothetical protein
LPALPADLQGFVAALGNRDRATSIAATRLNYAKEGSANCIGEPARSLLAVKTAGYEDCRLSRRHSLANCVGVEWKIPAPETWEAIRKAATTAGTLMSLRN